MTYNYYEVISVSFLNNSEYNYDQYDEFYANIIGTEVLKWLKEFHPESLAEKVENKTMSVLQEIESILNDDALDDSECFYRIDAIVRAFQNAGISVDRHWELD